MAKEYFGKTDLLYFVQLISTELAKYQKAAEGKGLSANDFTDTLKSKLDGIDLSQYSTTEEMNNAISTALNSITGISFKKPEGGILPDTGEDGVIYLIPNGGTNPNVFDEYFWDGQKFELFGTTAADLSGYIKSEDIQELTTEEVKAVWDSVFSA
jgi:hypothetical protein